MNISVVIRTLNEAKYLGQLLQKIEAQDIADADVEVVLVDSGSTDNTVEIAESYNCRIISIAKELFTFGRSINMGCDAATGDYLVFVSGHCVPVSENWLHELVGPLRSGEADYSYGRQIGVDDSKFSEKQLFQKYFDDVSRIPQTGYFCNNANAAISKKVWMEHRFDEEITGLEDMELAQRLQRAGLNITYIASAPVYHIHEETWRQVLNRYEREAYALQHIMPEVHIGFGDFIRYWASAMLFDMGVALEARVLLKVFGQIAAFRFAQFWGAYRGNHEHRQLSRRMRERYFYPR